MLKVLSNFFYILQDSVELEYNTCVIYALCRVEKLTLPLHLFSPLFAIVIFIDKVMCESTSYTKNIVFSFLYVVSLYIISQHKLIPQVSTIGTDEKYEINVTKNKENKGIFVSPLDFINSVFAHIQ